MSTEMKTYPPRKPFVVMTHDFIKEVVDVKLRPYAKVRVAKNTRELHKYIRSADALITRFSDPVTEELLSKAPKLKVVGNFAVGINNIDLNACGRHNVAVVNTPDVLTRAMAELTLGMLLASARRFPEADTLCRKGRFTGWEPDMLLGIELLGKTAVIVGEGRIGKETAKLFRGIGLKVKFITRSDSPLQIEKSLKKAHVLSLHIPLTEKTRHWLNARRLSLLPKDAIVINTSRGPVVDEKALIRALKMKRIFAAALDVYEEEPWIPKELRRLKNVLLLPHIGSATRKAREGIARLVVSGVLGVLGGKRPWNQVTFAFK